MKNETANGKKKEKRVREEKVKTNFSLYGNTILQIERKIAIFETIYMYYPGNIRRWEIVSKDKVGDRVENIVCQLTQVEAKELREHRRSGISGFVLKKDGNLYYAKIPDYNISFVGSTILGSHQCVGRDNRDCIRLSAASDENGGCAKVRNGAGIERYDWITEGYETFNMADNAFVVSKCLHCTKPPYNKKKKKNQEEIE